jgi:hypothetical protein
MNSYCELCAFELALDPVLYVIRQVEVDVVELIGHNLGNRL